MSASSKKKLRNAENAEKLTERQLAEQKEAKKTRNLTIVMVIVIAAMVVLAAWTMISNTIVNSGVRERSTVAVTVGDHEISNAELNYFFVDAVNNFYSTYGSYASMFGLDFTKPLNEQYVDEEQTTTWADDFLQSAIDNAASVYALADEANAKGYTLSEAELEEIDANLSYASLYAGLYGYSDADAYLKAMYGNGASEESLRAYYQLTTLAQSYYNSYAESLTYTDEQLREAEAENYDLYSSFSYNYYSLNVSRFYEGGTTDAEGNTTYTDAEIAAAEAACLAAAEELAAGTYASVEEFNAAINALAINADAESEINSVTCHDYSYNSINALYSDWITDDARQAGDITVVANTSHTHEDGEEHSDDEDASEHETLNGYYVVYYVGTSDNNFALKNVRHILSAFEGGTTDEDGVTTYSDEEMSAALTEAEDLLAQWESGEATEDSFAALANEHSDDGDGTTGGLYEDIYTGQMVDAFNDWCFDESRQPGDTDIVETEYGYHVMYFVGDSDTTYRDWLITNDLTTVDVDNWYMALLDSVSITDGDTKYVVTDLVFAQG